MLKRLLRRFIFSIAKQQGATGAELQKLAFNVRDIPIKYWGNDRMAFVLIKLKDLESVVE